MKGNFKARAIKAEPGKSSKKGTEQVTVTFRIEGTNDEVRWDGYFTDKTSARTIESLMYCGWDGEDFVMFSGIDKNVVPIVVEEEDWVNDAGETKTRTRVAWVNDPNYVGASKPMNAGELTDFASRMKGHVLAAKEKRAKAASESVGGPKPKF